MQKPRIYADFQNLDNANRLVLNCAGTLEDLKRNGIELQDGLVLTFYTDDADDQGQDDELKIEGVVHFDSKEGLWVAEVNWAALSHASDEPSPNGPPTKIANR
jgi:hypothetical protein